MKKKAIKAKKTSKNSTSHVIWKNKQITSFERKVYELISKIPKGKVSTYGQISHILKSSPRAVGQALRKNPFVPEIPCHRIVAASRAIGGYKGSTGSHSVDEKIKLLTKEGVTFVEDPNKVDASCIYLYD